MKAKKAYDARGITERELAKLVERSPRMYLGRSHLLWEASLTLDREWQSTWVTVMAGPDGDVEPALVRKMDLTVVAAMLRALSVENLLKAIHYHREKEKYGDILHKNTRRESDHKLKALATRLNLGLDEADLDRLSYLEVMILLGRYPSVFKECKKTGQVQTAVLSYGTDATADEKLRSHLLKLYKLEDPQSEEYGY